MRRCLSAAFEPYRLCYTEGLYADTVPALEQLAERCRDMTVLGAFTAVDEMVGSVAHALAGNGEGHLRGMAVLPEYHGRGVASQLLHTAESELRALGCTVVTLDTTEPLRRAMTFYEKHGYRRSGNRRTVCGMALIEYRKALDPR